MAILSLIEQHSPHLLSLRGVFGILALFVAYNVVKIVVQAIYNLYFHPLSHVPGYKPWIAFPILSNISLARGDSDYVMRDLHEKFGDVVRYRPDAVSFTTAAAWKDVYGHGHAELLKYYQAGLDIEKEPKLISANSKDHFRIRRAMLPAFSSDAVSKQEALIKVYVDKLIDKLHGIAKSRTPLTDMVKWYTFTTFDLIGDLVFGESFNGLDLGESHQYITNIETMHAIYPIQNLLAYFPLLHDTLMYLFGAKIKAALFSHMKMSKDLTLKRINNKDQDRRGDFMDFFMRSRGQEHALSDHELSSNVDTLIIAGSDTTATLLCGVTYYLLSSPDALTKCVQEVRSAFDSDDQITFKQASMKLPYMLMCLDEALRLFPPAPSVQPRRTNKGDHTPIAGYMIPPDTSVGVHHLAAYHNDRIFHNARSFVPERWSPQVYNDPTSPYHTDKREIFKPFSHGPRDCIGRNLAYHEMRLILARVLYNFDLELDPASHGWADNQKIHILWAKPDLLVRIKERIA